MRHVSATGSTARAAGCSSKPYGRASAMTGTFQKRRSGTITADHQADIFELLAKMPGNANTGQDRVGTASYHLLQYLLRVFKSRESTISNAVIHCDDYGSSIRAEESMEAST